jgi:hypothetical protein
VIQAACIALFQLLSKVLVLTALLLLRLMVMTAPAIAVVAVLKPEILPALLRVAGAAIVNTIVVGALAGCTRFSWSPCSGPARASTCGWRCWSPVWSRWCCGRWRGRSGGWCRWSP